MFFGEHKNVFVDAGLGYGSFYFLVPEEARVVFAAHAMASIFPGTEFKVIEKNQHDPIRPGDRLKLVRKKVGTTDMVDVGESHCWWRRCCRCGVVSPPRPCYRRGGKIVCFDCLEDVAGWDEELVVDYPAHVVESLALVRKKDALFVLLHARKACSLFCARKFMELPLSTEELKGALVEAKKNNDATSIHRLIELLGGPKEELRFWAEKSLKKNGKQFFIPAVPGSDPITLKTVFFELNMMPSNGVQSEIPKNQSCFDTQDSLCPTPCWNPSDPNLLAFSSDVPGTAVVMDVRSGKRQTFPSLKSKILALGWSMDGQFLYTAHNCGSICKYTKANGSMKVIFREKDMHCVRLVPNPSFPTLFACIWSTKDSRTYQLRIWNIGRGYLEFSCRVPWEKITCLWSPNGEWLAFDMGHLCFWSTKTKLVEISCEPQLHFYVGWSSNFEFITCFCCDLNFVLHHDFLVAWCSAFALILKDWNQKEPIKTILPRQDACKTCIREVTVSAAGKLAVLCSNGEMLVDATPSNPDAQAQVDVVTIALNDGGIAVKKAVDHLAEPVNPSEIEIEQREAEKGSSGRVFFGKYRKEDVAIKKMDCREIVNINELFHVARMERHENLIRYFGHYKEGDQLFIINEWIRGGCDLQVFLKDNGKSLSEYHRVRIARCVGKALKWLHSHDIIHGDVKEDNVVGDAMFFDQIKLIDFGISRNGAEGHLDLNGKIRGLNYDPASKMTLEDDVKAFKKHILQPVWEDSSHDILPSIQETSDMKSICHWLRRYHFHILRHARFTAKICDQHPVQLMQYRGEFVWEELVKHLERAGATVLSQDRYRIYKQDVCGGHTKCFVGCLDENNGKKLRLESSHAHIFKVGAGTRGGKWLYRSYVDFFGPFLVFFDNFFDMSRVVKTSACVLEEENFDHLLTDHPLICVERRDWRGKVVNRNGEVLTWCMNRTN